VVSVNKEVIASGEIKGHDRRKGWVNLVEMLAIHSNYEKAKSEIEQIKRDWCGE
jgi:hypothetical protein